MKLLQKYYDTPKVDNKNRRIVIYRYLGTRYVMEYDVINNNKLIDLF